MSSYQDRLKKAAKMRSQGLKIGLFQRKGLKRRTKKS